MTRFVPLTAAAGALACLLAAGSAQAAPVTVDVFGKSVAVKPAASIVDQVHWRRHHRWWRWHHHRRHHRYWRYHRRWW